MRGTTLTDLELEELIEISIHVPREGDDAICLMLRPCKMISIHVPREGDDSHAALTLETEP